MDESLSLSLRQKQQQTLAPMQLQFVRMLEMTGPELEGLLGKREPSVFYSGDLCAKYFTYTENGAGHFVLFDDGDTLRRKIETARRLGIRTFLAPWAEIGPHAAQAGIQRRQEQSRIRR